MCKFVKFILCMVLFCACMATTALGAVQPSVTMQLDGKVLTGDTPPVLQDGRVLLPARIIFESLDGEVLWDEATKTTTITANGNNIQLVINNKTATVNGKQVALDVPSRIINDRTMVPLRFVAENSGCQVDWDNTKKLVSIASPANGTEQPTTPEQPEPAVTEIATVKFRTEPGTNELLVEAKNTIQQYNVVESGSRQFVLEVLHAKLPIIPKEVTINHPLFASLTMQQQTADTVRITVQLHKESNASVTLSDDKKSLTAHFDSVGTEAFQPQGVSGLPDLNPLAAHKLIVIDAGHGGSDPGSVGKNSSATLEERTINLKVAQRTNQLLQQAGVRTYMIRTGDETLAAKYRPVVANVIGADMFVSIHNNSFDQSSAKGTETLWYDGKKNTQATYGITSKRLAEIAQKQLKERLGLTDRGIKERPGLVVLNSTKMPAFLMEGAFLSNPDDLAYMLTDDFVEQFAMAAAYTVVQGLNESVE